MTYFTNLKKIHDTAIVDEIDKNLFLVKYPGLELIVGIKYLLAFNAHDRWHCYIGKNSKEITRFKEIIKNEFNIEKWHDCREAMQNELLRLIEEDLQCQQYQK